MKRNILAGFLIVRLMITAAAAQNFTVDWLTVDGGGGASAGGVYSLNGTIGQSDAGGTISGGRYSLAGGFWNGVSLVQTLGAPMLAIERVAGGVRVFWPLPATGWLLEQNLSATGVWSPVSFPYTTNSTAISITAPVSSGNRFYRLRKP